ncbi:MAG: DEAD/DEAH box helicase [Pseudomonadales bacterium]|nr:DEAD/DEAH box helicase [Pseudomonadales bacterium]
MFYFDAVVNAFTTNEITKAKRNYQAGHATLVDIKTLPGSRGFIIYSECEGSGARNYTQNISLYQDYNSGWEVDGGCSCPVGYNCKHTACVLLAFAESQVKKSPKIVGASDALQSWFATMPEDHAVEDDSAKASDQLVYNVRLDNQKRWVLTVYKARQLKSGAYSHHHPKSMPFNNLSNAVGAAYMSDDDVVILGLLRASMFGSEFYYRNYTFADGDKSKDGIELKGDSAAIALKKAAASGRLFIGPIEDYQPFTLMSAQVIEPRWVLNNVGHQQMSLHELYRVSGFINSDPIIALSEQDAVFFPIENDVSLAKLQHLLTAPEIDVVQGQKFKESHLEQLQETGLPIPKKVTVKKLKRKYKPQLSLRLKAGDDEIPNHVQLQFVYPDMAAISEDYAEDFVSQWKDGVLKQLPRHRDAEKSAVTLLESMGFEDFKTHSGLDRSQFQACRFLANIVQWHQFLTEGVESLEELGWQVEEDEDFDLAFIQADDWYTDIGEDDAPNQWFSLEVGVEVAGKKVNLLPVLLQAMQGEDLNQRLQWMKDNPDADFPVQLETGQYIVLPVARVFPLLETFVELFDGLSDDGRLLLPDVQAGRLAIISGDDWRWTGGAKLKRLAQRLADFDGVQEVVVPETFHGTLRDYQQQGVNWLQFLREYEFSGILADDMGLGKTVQTLAHLCVEKTAGRLTKPCLIVAPTSLVGNWKKESAVFAPDLRVLALQGPERKQHFDDLNEYDIIISTYPLLKFDADVLGALSYSYLILDEAQNIKNPRSKAAQWVRSCHAEQRLCLTGTPMENHLGELWAIYDFLMPGLLGSEKEFARLYRKPIEQEGNAERHRALNKRLAPFLLRRTKQAVASELPEKTVITRSVALSGKQADLYETIRLSMHAKITSEVQSKGLARSHIMILDALLKLRQACCHPPLVKLSAAKKVTESAKLEMLMEMLPEMVEEGRKILVFSQFTSMLAVIEDELTKHKISFSKLTGKTLKREAAIEAFQEGDADVFLISLKAGGVGLNLTAADTVIHYDPWWNPAVEDQATDRAYRIGQDKPVFVYKLATDNTVEEKILQMQQRKRLLAEGTYTGKSQESVQISEQDLEDLFKPL